MKQRESFLKGIIDNRKLIFKLSKNDFKTKFAGSYLGIIWAFIQPVITVFVYWFVFAKALKPSSSALRGGFDVPYVLWLICGLVPWFFFSESFNQGSNALVDYNYLVKKVVFNVSSLPVVRVVSSIFVHLFFILFMIVMFACYGFFPNLYTIQVIYYSLCMFVLVLGLVYATSSIVVFFRDLSQIVNIILQVGIWATPIMWSVKNVNFPNWVMVLLKLNPMFYIVQGYRDSMIDQVWFWERPEMTIYYWVVTILLFWIGSSIFKKLRPHFADVL